jgi:hypothetical protein
MDQPPHYKMQREPVEINLADSENNISKFQLQLSPTNTPTQASKVTKVKDLQA